MDLAEHINNVLDQFLSQENSANEFNAVEYINKIFPNEQSLSNIDEVLRILKDKISFLDSQIRNVICSQKTLEQNGRRTLEDAQSMIIQLTNVIKDIKNQAKDSEKIVNEITCNIKQLDNAKRNLTASIIMLNNLHILVQGTFILKDTTQNQHYGAAAKTLQGILDVLKHFSRFKHIPHILKLMNEIEETSQILGQQILQEFYKVFDSKLAPSSLLTSHQTQRLAEGCMVLSILDLKYKRELLVWFVDIELKEYKTLFQENQDIAWLDKIEKRFNWLKKHLILFEEKLGFIFPQAWEVSECIALEFCRYTQKELVKVMNNRSIELDVKILLPAITQTTAFEKLLSQRFPGAASRDHLGHKRSGVSPFIGLIAQCFENHLVIYVDAQDKNFEKLIEQFVDEHKKQQWQNDQKAQIFSSSGKLFTQYKNCLIQCISLSNRQPLVLLLQTFQKYLRQYAHKILQNSIPRVGSSTSYTITNANGVLSAASDFRSRIQIFLNDLENKSYSVSEIVQICSIILTANYCMETTQQLSNKIQEKIDSSFFETVNLSGEIDIFHSISSNCIQLLSHSVEYSWEQPLTTMIKTMWSNAGTPIGPSSYVTQLSGLFHQTVPIVRENLHELPEQYFNFCTKIVTAFCAKFILYLYKCKPLSHGGAEQLLLDSHTLKKILLDLPQYKVNITNKIPQSYFSVVNNGMTKAEMILKIVLVSCNSGDIVNSHNMFVENYFKLFPRKDFTEFQKILDMKGIKKSENLLLCDLFKKKCTVDLSGKDNVRDGLDDGDPLSTNVDSSRIKKLEKLIKNRL